MSKQVTTRISPESIEIANAYLEKGDINAVSTELKVPRDVVSEYLNKREVKNYIDSVYLDAGYRNRFKLAEVMDTLIDKKLEEAEETEMYSNKDLADLLQMAHKMRMDEIKAQAEADPDSAGEQPQDTESLAQDVGLGGGDAMEAEPAAGGDLGGLEGLLEEGVDTEEDDLLNELMALLEDNEDVLDESLTVDVGEVKNGWITTDDGKRKYDAELELASQESTVQKERADELEKQVGDLKNSVLMYQDRQEKLHTVLDDMKGKLEEMILQNARLIYSNKVLSDASLNERQKSKIVEAIAKAETLKEAKTLYQTLKETTVGTPKERGPKSLSESVQRKQVLSAHLPRRKQENTSQEHDFASRMKKLAGLD